MEVDHNTLVAFAKSWGLFYLIAFAIVVLVYVFWPKNRKKFDDAKKSILDDKDDKPWQQ
ncbi:MULTISPECIES: cbb3-type cytochrome c oxidase subunit 3 [unclassified Sinorhizobium]|uniref:cbb3-type cytochrome c oxidase subunit 3 n=1 Tax=unclassified Sinorhizobium TaxID=2613772 RepID=UPI0024C31CC6|nr:MULTISPECIES: cbb3-type cytochrome c oxidase subunit 3 [unclassified Sinorhizobium]MDK1378405.1 cbb3-type cytochrome c oxidase subunit 3 [Sinorhizobium sp. 6-70]MDK1482436.1 cbb3-type cytochrome c oxidase subunit 3 [Sinorhizobium sp. 6-117]